MKPRCNLLSTAPALSLPKGLSSLPALSLPKGLRPLSSALLLVLAAVLCPPDSSAQVALRWTADTARPAAADFAVYQGETARLEPSFQSYGAALSLTNAAATLYWQTNGMGSAWWSKPAEIVAGSPDRVRAVFAPTNDAGASAYAYFIRLSGADGSSYRAFGTLALRASPGYSPAAAPAPTHYPALAAELAPLVAPLLSGSFATPAAVSGTAAVLRAEIASSTSGIPASVSAQIGAATGAVSSAWLSALSAFAASNKVTRFQDAVDPSVWWTAAGGTNLSSWTLSGTEFYYEADQLGGFIQSSSGPFPYVVPGEEEGFFDGGLASISLNGPGTWSSSSPAFPQALLNPSMPGTTAFVYRAAVVLESYNLTTGNVWQAVSAVQQTASEALLAAEQAATLFNYHTALDAAPHPGKFLVPGQTADAALGGNLTVSKTNTAAVLRSSGDLHVGGSIYVKDSYTNLVWRNVYSNGWAWIVAVTNTP